MVDILINGLLHAPNYVVALFPDKPNIAPLKVQTAYCPHKTIINYPG